MVSAVTTRVRMLSFSIDTVNAERQHSNTCFWHSPTIVLPVVYCRADDTLFEVGREIHCSGVSIHYCCYGNHTARSKPI